MKVTSDRNQHISSDCQAVNAVLARVGEKWSVLIIMKLKDGPLRFNELKRVVGGISQRMLTLTLRGLERDGLITRSISAGSAPAAANPCFNAARDFCACPTTGSPGPPPVTGRGERNSKPPGLTSLRVAEIDSSTTCAPSIGSPPA